MSKYAIDQCIASMNHGKEVTPPHCGKMLQRPNGYRWCKPVAGTLAFRDGFKTGPSTPNGQDAYDGKLVIW